MWHGRNDIERSENPLSKIRSLATLSTEYHKDRMARDRNLPPNPRATPAMIAAAWVGSLNNYVYLNYVWKFSCCSSKHALCCNCNKSVQLTLCLLWGTYETCKHTSWKNLRIIIVKRAGTCSYRHAWAWWTSYVDRKLSGLERLSHHLLPIPFWG
jgi:hypothetical protein